MLKSGNFNILFINITESDKKKYCFKTHLRRVKNKTYREIQQINTGIINFLGTAPESPTYDTQICRYAEFRNPPDDPHKYKRPLIYWHILAARLAFIVVYQNLVSFIVTVVEWTIPDISRKLNDRIKREAYKVNEIIIKNESERVKKRSNTGKFYMEKQNL